jgi:uncharacterized protein YegL
MSIQSRSSSCVVVLVLMLAALPAIPAAADLDVVFVLDTTGSMGGELDEVQQRVRQVAMDLARAREGERLRFGIVAFRDRGDEYVTTELDLTTDIAAAEAFLSSLTADGGGDGPESVVAAVDTALHRMSWDRADGIDRQVFLIGDAPPHLDYPDDPPPMKLVTDARDARIVVNTIGCRSLSRRGVDFFRWLAYATEGSYQHIGRVTSARPGELAEALTRTAAPSASDRPGRELDLEWVAHLDASTDGILVRQGGPDGVPQSREGDGLAPCALEIRLPEGFALELAPRVRLDDGGLQVELELTEGPGGIELFTLRDCPATTTPVHVRLGGAS